MQVKFMLHQISYLVYVFLNIVFIVREDIHEPPLCELPHLCHPACPTLMTG